MNFKIRRFQERDAAEVSAVIGEALRVSNAPDYPPEIIREMLELYTPENLLEQAGSEHLVTIFVLPEYQRRSAGRRIMEALERDPYFLRADRVAVHSSITARDFYLRLGYRFSDGVGTPDEEGCIRMEKRR